MTELEMHIRCKEMQLQRLEAKYHFQHKGVFEHPLVGYALDYLEELQYLKEFIGLNCKVVGQATFQKVLERSDFYEFCLDGNFVRIARVSTFPYDPVYLITLANVIKD